MFLFGAVGPGREQKQPTVAVFYLAVLLMASSVMAEYPPVPQMELKQHCVLRDEHMHHCCASQLILHPPNDGRDRFILKSKQFSFSVLAEKQPNALE